MKRILIADDNPMVRRGLIEHNQEWDVCGEAMNGREAIEQARALHSDVLLLDLVMPEMNGFDIAREVAKVEPKVQILLCTVQLSTYVVREAKGSGSAGRCRKRQCGKSWMGLRRCFGTRRSIVGPLIKEARGRRLHQPAALEVDGDATILPEQPA